MKDLIKNNNLSYWELKHYFNRYNLIVVGAGIVGLNSAISYKLLHKKAKILVIERGILPNGASTKNAGFACFGTAGELLDDLKKTDEKTVFETVKMRWKGLQLLRNRLKDKNIDYKGYGGYELFTNRHEYKLCQDKIDYLNKTMNNTLGLKNCYKEVSLKKLRFNGLKGVLFNSFEGQIDTGRMMKNLLHLCRSMDIEVLANIDVEHLLDASNQVEIKTNIGVLKAEKVIVATNGFAQQLLKIADVLPARAQVLITAPIKSLKIKGTFHFDKGYYYFRNIDNRILFGGGRNLDFKKEQTTSQVLNKEIQKHLENLLKQIILPDTSFSIEHRWTGIMGVGKEKKPIIEKVSTNVLAAVRMGGMGIAIGSLVGDMAARKIS